MDSWCQNQARRFIDLCALGCEEVAITYTVTAATRRQWATSIIRTAGPTKECFGSTRKVKNGATSRKEDLNSRSQQNPKLNYIHQNTNIKKIAQGEWRPDVRKHKWKAFWRLTECFRNVLLSAGSLLPAIQPVRVQDSERAKDEYRNSVRHFHKTRPTRVFVSHGNANKGKAT